MSPTAFLLLRNGSSFEKGEAMIYGLTMGGLALATLGYLMDVVLLMESMTGDI